ncbi:MAG: GumC family protein [Peptococcia bacterium]|jgi:succinoglycan biosynthesis transport protein ExoP
MEEEISLRELIEILWAGKGIIITLTVIALIVSGVVNFFVIKPTYQAKTVLAVNQPEDLNQAKTVINVNLTEDTKSSVNGLADLVNSLTGIPQVNIQSYLSQAKSEAALAEVCAKLQSNSQIISPQTLASKINITNPKDTNLLEVAVKDQSPQRAAEIANTFAEEFIVFVANTNEEQKNTNLELLEKQANDERLKLEGHVDEMKEVLKQPESVMELETELENSLNLLSEFQIRKANLQIEIQKTATAIATIENQLADIPEKIEVNRGFQDTEFISEELNPVYLELKMQMETNQILLAQLNVEQSLIDQEIGSISANIKNLQVKLADKKMTQEQIQNAIDTAKQNYNLFNQQYIEAKIVDSLINNQAILTVVSPAHVPSAPIAPRKALNLAVAACLGLMLGVFVVLFKAYWASSAVDRKQVF